VPKSRRKIDGLSLVFIDFYVPAHTPRLNFTETSLQISENINLFAVCCIYIYSCHQQRDLNRHQMFGAYHLYIDCTIWGAGRNFVTPLLVYTFV
jgi:hypothetical protein